jgi:hypothetical protein
VDAFPPELKSRLLKQIGGQLSSTAAVRCRHAHGEWRVQLSVGLRFRKSVDYIRHEEVTDEKGRLDLNNPRISIRGIEGVCGASLVGRS